MMESLPKTIEQLKRLTASLSKGPLQNHKDMEALFGMLQELVKFLVAQNKEQRRLLDERGALEEIAKTSEARYKTVFEHSLDAIFLMRKNVFVDCNKKALEMFRCGKKDILNSSPVEFSPTVQPDGKPSCEESIHRMEETVRGSPQSFPWSYLTKDGTSFAVHVNLDRIEMNDGNWLIAYLHKYKERKPED